MRLWGGGGRGGMGKMVWPSA